MGGLIKSKTRRPATDAALVVSVIGAKLPFEIVFFPGPRREVPQQRADRDVSQNQRRTRDDSNRGALQKRTARHRITHRAIRPRDHQTPRRVDGQRRALAARDHEIRARPRQSPAEGEKQRAADGLKREMEAETVETGEIFDPKRDERANHEKNRPHHQGLAQRFEQIDARRRGFGLAPARREKPRFEAFQGRETFHNKSGPRMSEGNIKSAAKAACPVENHCARQ